MVEWIEQPHQESRLAEGLSQYSEFSVRKLRSSEQHMQVIEPGEVK